MTRTNRVLIAYIDGTAPLPRNDGNIMDGLLANVEQALKL